MFFARDIARDALPERPEFSKPTGVRGRFGAAARLQSTGRENQASGSSEAKTAREHGPGGSCQPAAPSRYDSAGHDAGWLLSAEQ